MTNVQNMLQSHKQSDAKAGVADLIAAALECVQTCTSCADACLAEEQLQMLRRCIRTDLDCADICDVTARVLSRQTETDTSVQRQQVVACQTVCRLCAEECQKHASKHEHCRICAEACRRCEQACGQVVSAL